MEHSFFFRYPWGYETPRDPATTGAAAPTGHPVVESRDTPVGGGPLAGRIQELRLPVVRSVQEEGTQRSSPTPHSGASSQVVQGPETTAGDPPAGRPPGVRSPHRPVDLEAHRPADPEAVSDSLSPQPCLAIAARDGVELPETGASSAPTGRRRDRPLEASPLAPYKKTPSDLGPIWSSSMSRASCSFPMSAAPGRPRGKRPSSTIGTTRTESRRSVRWQCPRDEGAWPFTSSFAPAISPVWMSEPSFTTCSGIFRDRSSCCGIGEPSTGAEKSSNGSVNIQDSTWNISPPTPRNSTPPSMSGIKRIGRSPTVRQRTWPSLKEDSETRCEGSGDPKSSCGPVSMLPIYPGPDESFLYLCETQ